MKNKKKSLSYWLANKYVVLNKKKDKENLFNPTIFSRA